MEIPVERLVAQTILQRCDAFYSRFLEITRGAKTRFENADWTGVQIAAKERIRLYDQHVHLAAEKIRHMMAQSTLRRQLLYQVKEEYIALLDYYPNFEVAESFFNSVYGHIFRHRTIYPPLLFLQSSQQGRREHIPGYLFRRYQKHTSLAALFEQILADCTFTIPWENKAHDLTQIMAWLEQHAPEDIVKARQLEILVFRELFYRNKGAYLVGIIQTEEKQYPMMLPILNNEEGSLFIDTLLLDPDDISIVFGFARAYFFVYTTEPGALVTFLRQLLPNKTDYEIYSAIGCQKHAKTEFYRHYQAHLSQSNDQFEPAPGIKGMVMCVFTLPSYDVVFKVIKDRFAPPKAISKEEVKAKYRLVKQHDRIGRMADTQEFSNFEFPRHRFSPALLEELQQEVPSAIKLTRKKVIVRHLYCERKMTPLNLYLNHANERQLMHIIEEYGNAIKQLAAANIFPGDMLFKNFGVTRHRRVIFYDYDEISYMTECNFRRIPPPRYPEDELAAEPWYSIAPNDIFPEEFGTFLLCKPEIRRIFMQTHAELLDADYWKGLQQDIVKGCYKDIFPYHSQKRFKRATHLSEQHL